MIWPYCCLIRFTWLFNYSPLGTSQSPYHWILIVKSSQVVMIIQIKSNILNICFAQKKEKKIEAQKQAYDHWRSLHVCHARKADVWVLRLMRTIWFAKTQNTWLSKKKEKFFFLKYNLYSILNLPQFNIVYSDRLLDSSAKALMKW